MVRSLVNPLVLSESNLGKVLAALSVRVSLCGMILIYYWTGEKGMRMAGYEGVCMCVCV